MANKYAMTPEDLQALRDQADVVGLRDVELAKFLQLLIPHVAHAHGLDPLEEDEKAREDLEERQEKVRKAQEKRAGKEEALTPAQEESKRIAKEQGRPYAPGHHEQLDPVAKETQDKGIGTVPTLQAEEALLNEGPRNVQDPANSSLADLSSSETAPNKQDGKHHHGKGKH